MTDLSSLPSQETASMRSSRSASRWSSGRDGCSISSTATSSSWGLPGVLLLAGPSPTPGRPSAGPGDSPGRRGRHWDRLCLLLGISPTVRAVADPAHGGQGCGESGLALALRADHGTRAASAVHPDRQRHPRRRPGAAGGLSGRTDAGGGYGRRGGGAGRALTAPVRVVSGALDVRPPQVVHDRHSRRDRSLSGEGPRG